MNRVVGIALLLQCAAVAVAAEGRVAHTLDSAVLQPKSLWPGGRIPYYIETVETVNNAHRPLRYNEQRVLLAIAHWEERTCLKFRRCEKASCPKPHVRFVASGGDNCGSPVGRVYWGEEVNQINLGVGCSYSIVITQIGHTVGLNYEQMRKDRDEHVFIDFTQVEGGRGNEDFQKSVAGSDIGTYNFKSVMHYKKHAQAVGANPTIVTAHALRAAELTEGDVATVHFMYNTCKDTFEAPLCAVSKRTDVTHTIQHSTTFKVEFNTVYKAGAHVTVSYSPSTTSKDSLEHTVAEGGKIKQMGPTVLTFTPKPSDNGKTFTLGVRFSGEDGSTTCSVKVQVGAGQPTPATPVPTPVPATPEPTPVPTPVPTPAVCRNGEQCHTDTGCCESGTKCYAKNNRESICRPSCPSGWACDPRREMCSSRTLRIYDDCTASPFCCGSGLKCFEKNEFYAQCLPANKCPPQPWERDWSCRNLGSFPRDRRELGNANGVAHSCASNPWEQGDLYCDTGVVLRHDSCTPLPRTGTCAQGRRKCFGRSWKARKARAVMTQILKNGLASFNQAAFNAIVPSQRTEVARLLARYACPANTCNNGHCSNPLAAAIKCLRVYDL